MIIVRPLACYDTVDHSTAGLIIDLRSVIAKSKGRGKPPHYSTTRVIDVPHHRYREWRSGGRDHVEFSKGFT